MSENEDGRTRFEELTLVLTLLVGSLTALFKIVEYFNSNVIIDESIALAIVFLTAFLLIEVLLLLLFLLFKGCSLWAPKEHKERLDEISSEIGLYMFGIPIFLILYVLCLTIVILLMQYTGLSIRLSIIWMERITNYILIISLVIILILVIVAYFLKVIRPIIVPVVSGFVIVVAAVIGASLGAFLLLSGTYSIDMVDPPGNSAEIISFTITDTGIPSGRCFIYLHKANYSSETLFNNIDNIIINTSGENSSKYMRGEKRSDGIYYLFINTSNLPSDYYTLDCEVTFKWPWSSFLKRKKLDTAIFYIPYRNGTS
ncbi:hypothetical protein AIOGIFDO_00072 [Candidatus Methanoperedenaceae archaeon GB37]|nr:hypothetical protein AIOGIFDO_00072 [Candidatus Methanoperedenaceae archaeon GB37]